MVAIEQQTAASSVFSNRPSGGYIFTRANGIVSSQSVQKYWQIGGLDSNKKGGMLLPPFLPQIYHKLNLLMLWWYKCIVKELF